MDSIVQSSFLVVATDVATPIASKLAALAQRINAEHEGFELAGKQTILHAMSAGEALLEVKAGLPHGELEAWLKANCRFSIRTAQQYMRAARHRDQIKAQSPAHLTDALAMLSKGSKKVAGPRPLRDWTPEHRREHCRLWWDQQAKYTLLLSADGMAAADIASYLGTTLEDTNAILTPRFPARQNHELQIIYPKSDVRAALLAAYNEAVEHDVHTQLAHRCDMAAVCAEPEGLGHTGLILTFERDRHLREAKSREPYILCDDHQTRLTLMLCVWEDTRRLLGIEASPGSWSEMFIRLWDESGKAMAMVDAEAAA